MNATQKNLYNEVVEITQDLLGPASEQFIARQIKSHLNKEPHELQAKDLIELSKWIQISVALLTEDGQIVDRYTASLMALTKKTAH